MKKDQAKQSKTVKTFAKKKHETYLFYKQFVEKCGIEALELCISKGNSKIGKVMNVSLVPIDTCGGCISGRCKCWEICYDIRSCVQYDNVMKARVRNTIIAMNDRDRFFDDIDKAMARRKKNKMLRWHVGGEIPDFDYFCRMVDIAKKHPDFYCWTYTKCYWIVNQYCDQFGRDAIPANFTIMFSEWRGYDMHNPYGFPEFRVVFKDDPLPHPAGFYCPGNCDICKALHKGCIAAMTTYANEH